MGLPGAKKTPTGAWATDVKVLEDLAEQGHRPAPHHRRLAPGVQAEEHLYRRPGRRRLARPPGGCTPRFSLAAASTGRLASSDPNLQNIPIRTEEGRKLRTCFIAEPGNVLISADYSQIELRLLAHIGDIPQLKAAFAQGMDIHAITASEIFGVPVEGMPSEVRRRAKAINFGIVYGISAFGLANQLGIEQKEAGDYIKTLFRALPRHPHLYGGHPRLRPRARLRHHPVRAQDQHPGDPRPHRRPSAASATAPPSTPRSRAPPPTSSAGP